MMPKLKTPYYFSLIIFAVITIGISNTYVFAQSSDVNVSEQTTLSGDLANDPVAQDILRKIELTKKWIAELEQREYEKLQSQKFLDDKRQVALERLNQDLKEWEKLWEDYSSKNAFERFVADKPSQVQGVFWDQFEFKEMKVKAGRDALKKVRADGGTLSEAREAYLKAAETKRIELIEQNNKFNVKHNLAYYNQQLLFNSEGQFIETIDSGEKLRKYYEDYKENPGYILANPNDDALSWDSSRKTNSQTQCREGYIVVHRIQQNDYICVNEATSEMWIRHGIGEITGKEKMVSVNEQENKIQDTIKSINEQIFETDSAYKTKQVELKNLYNKKYQDLAILIKNNEKQILNNYNANKTTTGEEVSQQILDNRMQFRQAKELLLDEKLLAVDDYKREFDSQILEITKNYEDSLDIKIIWNSDISGYQAVMK